MKFKIYVYEFPDNMKIIYTEQQIKRLNEMLVKCPAVEIYDIIYNSLTLCSIVSNSSMLSQMSLPIDQMIHIEYPEINSKKLNSFIRNISPLYFNFFNLNPDKTWNTPSWLTFHTDCLFWLIEFWLILIDPMEKNCVDNEKFKSHNIELLYLILKHYYSNRSDVSEDELEGCINKIYSIANNFNIELPEELKIKLRCKKICLILDTEAQVEDHVSPNLKKVIQDKDLNRYLMGFI